MRCLSTQFTLRTKQNVCAKLSRYRDTLRTAIEKTIGILTALTYYYVTHHMHNNRDPYIAKPSRLIAPEDERAMLDKLLNDPRGERTVRRQRLYVHRLFET
jgi:hypothetical protein